jgi:hypothetical protein
MIRALGGILIAAATAAACSGGGDGARPAEEVKRTLRHKQQVMFHDRKFVVGLSEGDDRAGAAAAAYAAITSQLAWLPEGSRDLLRGLYRIEQTATDRTGRIHLLAVLDREAASAQLVRTCDERRRAAGPLLARCREQLKAGELDGAARCLEEPRRAITLARVLLAGSRTVLGEEPRADSLPEEKVLSDLAAGLATARTRGLSAIVRVLVTVDGREGEPLDARFREVAAAAGLKVASGEIESGLVDQAIAGSARPVAEEGARAGAGYVIVGRVAARFEAAQDGQFFAYADGRLRVVETTGRRAVAEVNALRVKGGHLSRARACEKAVENAVERLAMELAARLRELGRR